MDSTTGISVIIPAYNAAEVILIAIDSIRNAYAYARRTTYPVDCEIIVVDDVSTDETATVADEMNTPDCPVRVIRHAVKQGCGIGRNTGANNANFDILCFLDADDLYRPEHLAVCAAAFAQHPNIDFVRTRQGMSRPIHPSWIQAISNTQVNSLAVRREAHLYIGGFPTGGFQHGMYADVQYQQIAERFLRGLYVQNETALYTWRAGSAYDRQLAKFRKPISERSSSETEGIPAEVADELRDRIAALAAKPPRK